MTGMKIMNKTVDNAAIAGGVLGVVLGLGFLGAFVFLLGVFRV